MNKQLKYLIKQYWIDNITDHQKDELINDLLVQLQKYDVQIDRLIIELGEGEQ